MNDAADSTDLKQQFALSLLLRHGDALDAARDVVPLNAGFARFVAEHWPDDLYVLQCKQGLIAEHGEAFFLPSRYDVAHRIMQTADRALDNENRLKALKLYAELMGYIEKPGVVINSSVTNNANRVMVLRDHGSDAEWERKLVSSQAQLIADAGH